MNGRTHMQYAAAAWRYLQLSGGASKASLGQRDEFVRAAAMPDQVDEVAAGGRVEMLGHNLSSFQHFQGKHGEGYAWDRDPSLSVAGDLSAPIPELAGLVVAPNANGLRPPLPGLPEDTPMQLAAAAQPGVALGYFAFPPASSSAEFFARAALGWLASVNAVGWRMCAGYAIHFVQDCCVPHHAAGALLWGHSEWENQLEGAWDETWGEVSGDLFPKLLVPAIARELPDFVGAATVADLCIANADWTRRTYGRPQVLETCPGDVALRVSVRAIASSVFACQLMDCPF